MDQCTDRKIKLWQGDKMTKVYGVYYLEMLRETFPTAKEARNHIKKELRDPNARSNLFKIKEM